MLPTETVKPNVVFILTDDQGYGDLSCTGNPIVQTPNIDQLCSQSVHFTNFHVGPTCAPTRSTLLTGHYANSTGVWHTIGGRSLLRKNEWTLPTALRENGYVTGIFGKWHLGDAYPYRPQDRGFDTTVVHGGGGVGQTPDHWGNDYFDDTYLFNGEQARFSGYCTDVFFAQAVNFISEHRSLPFFCYIATNAPHKPYNVESRYSDLYRGRVPEERANFFGMITCIDDNIGLLRDKLRDWGLEENTIFVFMTDNGTSGGVTLDDEDFVVDGYNASMRGRKCSPYDGGHRTPFFLYWPKGGLDKGTEVDNLTASIDFMPTILELCSVDVPLEHEFHGSSLKPLLYKSNRDWPDRVLVTDSQRVAQPIKWRQSAVMSDRWRLVNGAELYEIAIDPEQRHDVAAEHPEVVESLRQEYERWWDTVSEQFGEEIPFVVGSPESTEIYLTAHDWRNPNCDCPWDQVHIRQGQQSSGYWEIKVETAGSYLIELRRWPPEAHIPIAAGIAGDDVEWRKDVIADVYWSSYTGGVALSIRQAKLRIAGHESIIGVQDGEESVQIKVSLPKGATHLEAIFCDDTGQEIVGAYYVCMKQLKLLL